VYSGENSRVNLLPIVSSQNRRLCKLDQDRIYELLGLSSTLTGPDFEIKYGTSVESVYTRFALYYLRRNNIDILHYLSSAERKNPHTYLQPTKEVLTVLPSWVPDCKSVQLLFFISLLLLRRYIPVCFHTAQSKIV